MRLAVKTFLGSVDLQIGKPNPQSAPLGEVAEIGRTGSWFGGKYFTAGDETILANPDYLITSVSVPGEEPAGKGLDYYREMQERDIQIAQCLRTRRLTVTGRDWSIMPASEDKKDIDVADFVRWNLENRLDNFSEDLGELVAGIAAGFATSEIIWQYANGKIVIDDLKARRPSRFAFNGNGDLLFPDDQDRYKVVPEKKFLVFRNTPYAENPYGEPVLASCFWPYWFKKNCTKFWAMFTERFADPIPIITVGGDIEIKPADKAKLDDMLLKLQKGAGMRIPEGIKLEYLEAMRRGDAGYEVFIRYCDEQIAKQILGQTLTSGEGQRVGSLALGEVHAGTFWNIVAGDVKALTATVAYLIQWLVDFNFVVDKYPTFKIDLEPAEDLTAEAQRLSILIKDVGLPIAAEWAYQRFGIPKPEPGQDVLQPPKASPFGMSAPVKPEIELGTVYPENVPYPRPIGGSYNYDAGRLISIRKEFSRQLEEIFGNLRAGYTQLLEDTPPMAAAIEDLIRTRFKDQLQQPLTNANLMTIREAAESLIDKLKTPLSEPHLKKIASDYLKRHAYDKGVIEDAGEYIKRLLSANLDNIYGKKLGYGETVKQLMAHFDGMAEWKAKQIAYTEIQRAANYAGIEVIKDIDPKADAWFILSPKACPICEDIALGNPYSIKAAESILLPHPNCECQWSFSLSQQKEEK